MSNIAFPYCFYFGFEHFVLHLNEGYSRVLWTINCILTFETIEKAFCELMVRNEDTPVSICMLLPSSRTTLFFLYVARLWRRGWESTSLHTNSAEDICGSFSLAKFQLCHVATFYWDFYFFGLIIHSISVRICFS